MKLVGHDKSVHKTFSWV